MLPNSVPYGFSSAFQSERARMIYVANNNYDKFWSLGTVKVYPYLSSLFEVDGVVYVPVNPSQRTCDVIDCNYNDTIDSIVVPQAVSYKGVTMYPQDVNRYSFFKYAKASKAILSNNGYIGAYAFNDCKKLTSVKVFGGVTKIGDYAFRDCASLAELTLTDSVTEIGYGAFSSSGLKNFTFPAELTSLGGYALGFCKNLERVKVNGKLTGLNEYLFSGCSSLSGISIPANIKSVADGVFNGCTSLATLIIENDTDTLSLGNSGKLPLFIDCHLDSVYVGTHISYNTSKDYSYSPFYRNATLRAVHIGNNVNKVYDNEFYGCTGLKTAIIGESVTGIGSYAFSGCSSMESFLFGKNVRTIGEEAFSDCTALTKLEAHSATPPACGTEALDDINKWNCTLYVPKESLPAYQAADQWKEFFFIKEKEITGIQKTPATAEVRETARYSADGKRLNAPVKGLNIVRYSDGSVRKVIVP